MRPLWAALLLLSGHSFAAEHLTPFTTDGCSAFPDGTRQQQQLWLSCCIKHDIAYWQGGSYPQRLAADEQLQQCVAALGQPQIAWLMLVGVSIGGSAYWPTDFRWGYGWPYLRGYQPLDANEQQQVQQQLLQLPVELRKLLNRD